jgi:uncharacterized C2H2 Zn-finger protein
MITTTKTIVKSVPCPQCQSIHPTKGSLTWHLRKTHNYTENRIKEFKKTLKHVQTESVKKAQEKIKATNLERYGAENVFGAESIKNKVKATNLEKYGTENVFAAECVKDKIKVTNLEKYGAENVFAAESIKDKIKATNLERYGVEHTFQSPEIKDKIKDSLIARYGVDNPMKADSIKAKTNQTNLERYGYKWLLESPEIQRKSEETCLKKYGFKQAAQSDEVKAVAYQTALNKYGCWFTQTDKHQKSMYHRKSYTLPSGKVVKVQGHEDRALDLIFETYNESDVLIKTEDIKNSIGEIWYIGDDKKNHRYFPDIFIISENRVVEVKSEYTYESNRKVNEQKKKAVIDAGYNFNFIIFP